MSEEKTREYREKLTEVEVVEQMISRLKAVKSHLIKRKAMSEKRANMTHENNSPRQFGKAEADLNWHCMSLDQRIVDVARFYKGSFLDVSTEEREYNPSAFHKYKY